MEGLIGAVAVLGALVVMVIGYLLRERLNGRRTKTSNPHSDHDLLVQIDANLTTINERLSEMNTSLADVPAIRQRQEDIWNLMQQKV